MRTLLLALGFVLALGLSAFAQDSKVSDLTSTTSVDGSDEYIYIVEDISGTPVSRRVKPIDLIQQTTVSGLGAAGTAYRLRWVTDCESAVACSAGGGVNVNLVYDDGSEWVCLSCTVAASTPTLTQVMGAGNTYYGVDCTITEALVVGEDSNNHWRICYHATNGLMIQRFVGGVEDAGDLTFWVRDTYNFLINNKTDGTTIFKIDADAKTITGTAVKKSVQVELFDPTTDNSTGDGKRYFRIPATLDGYTLTAITANVITAGTTGTVNVDLARCVAAATGNVCSSTVADMLSTNLTIDSGENSSSTAATAAVIDTANDDVSAGQIIRFDVDAVHTTPAKGLIVDLVFTAP